MIASVVALAIVGCGLVIALVAWLRTHQFAASVALMLDLWVAAGLLRLTQSASWQTIGGAAAVICVRKLVVHALATTPARVGRVGDG